jgi:hypothetical protein
MKAEEFLESKNIWVDQPDVYDHGTIFREIGIIGLLNEYASQLIPSDEEIEKTAEVYATEEGGEDHSPMIAQPDYLGFYDGAKWLKNRITNKVKQETIN